MFLITFSFLYLRKQTLISNIHQNITQTTYLMQIQIPFSKLHLTKNEISVIISSLDSHKPSAPNSISVKILKITEKAVKTTEMTFLNN